MSRDLMSIDTKGCFLHKLQDIAFKEKLKIFNQVLLLPSLDKSSR